MRASILTLLTLFSFSHALPSGAGGPLKASSKTVIKRDDTWEGDPDGNVRATAGDNIIDWGHHRPAQHLNHIKEHCSTTGCHGDDILSIDTRFFYESINYPTFETGTIKMSIEASFASEGQPGSRDEMVDIVKAIAEENMIETRERYYNRVGCEHTGCGPNDVEYMIVHEQTDSINVRVEDDGNLVSYIHVRVTTEHGGTSGWCSTISQVGGAVSSAVGAVAGPVFGLIGLGCAD